MVARQDGDAAFVELGEQGAPGLLRSERGIHLASGVLGVVGGEEKVMRGRLEAVPRGAQPIGGVRGGDVGDVESKGGWGDSEQPFYGDGLRRLGSGRVPLSEVVEEMRRAEPV